MSELNDAILSLVPHGEQLQRLDTAVKALLSVVFSDPHAAAGALLGSALMGLRELGYSDDDIHQAVQRTLDAFPSVEVALRRFAMRDVNAPQEPPHG